MIKLLAVDDENISRMIIAECLEEAGYQVDLADDGEAAWQLMQKNDYDIVLLDRMMPNLDGIALLKRAKVHAKWKSLPVIMQTGAANPQQVRDGVEAGAYYYLVKPYMPKLLRALVNGIVAALGEKNRLRELGRQSNAALRLLEQAEFSFRSLEDARALAGGLGGLCQANEGVSMGLFELLVNAVEHGNLGISYAEKSQLCASEQEEAEIARRLQCEPWQNRCAQLAFRHDGDEVEFIISDQGDGFDWTAFLDFSPERAFDLNGRGIAMASRSGFTSLKYQGNGNRVIARAVANSTCLKSEI